MNCTKVTDGSFIIVAAVKDAYSASAVPLWECSLPNSDPDGATNDGTVTYNLLTIFSVNATSIILLF
jgi:hypothetical protein